MGGNFRIAVEGRDNVCLKIVIAHLLRDPVIRISLLHMRQPCIYISQLIPWNIIYWCNL